MAKTITLANKLQLYNNQYTTRSVIDRVINNIDTNTIRDLKSDLECLERLWETFRNTHHRLLEYCGLRKDKYFVEETYSNVQERVDCARQRIISLLREKGSCYPDNMNLYCKSHELRYHIDRIADNIKNPRNCDLESNLQSIEDLWTEFHYRHEILLQYPGIKDHNYFVQGIYEKVKAKAIYTRQQIIYLMKARAEGLKETNNLKPEIVTPQKSLENEDFQQKQNKSLISHFFFGIENLSCQLKNVDNINRESYLEEMLVSWEKERTNILCIYVRLLSQYLFQEDEIIEAFKSIEIQYYSARLKAFQKLEALSLEKMASKLNIHEIQHFEGNIEEWPSFHQKYTKLIHDEKTLLKEEKMSYLKSLVKNEAFKMIENLAVSAVNYDEAWNILNERFYNKRIMFQSLMDKILDKPNIDINNAAMVKSLLDTTNDCVQELYAMGDNMQNADSFIAYIVTKKLGKSGLLLYNQYAKNVKEIQGLEDVVKFLKHQCQALEPAKSNTSANCKDGQNLMQ